MKKDLWSDLARRVRDSRVEEESPIPFGFEQAVLRDAWRVPGISSNPFESWISVLRPALGLAFATAVLCVLMQYRTEQKMPNDPVAQTEALFQMAILNEPAQ
jgi:hypothetical protein